MEVIIVPWTTAFGHAVRVYTTERAFFNDHESQIGTYGAQTLAVFLLQNYSESISVEFSTWFRRVIFRVKLKEEYADRVFKVLKYLGEIARTREIPGDLLANPSLEAMEKYFILRRALK